MSKTTSTSQPPFLGPPFTRALAPAFGLSALALLAACGGGGSGGSGGGGGGGDDPDIVVTPKILTGDATIQGTITLSKAGDPQTAPTYQFGVVASNPDGTLVGGGGTFDGGPVATEIKGNSLTLTTATVTYEVRGIAAGSYGLWFLLDDGNGKVGDEDALGYYPGTVDMPITDSAKAKVVAVGAGATVTADFGAPIPKLSACQALSACCATLENTSDQMACDDIVSIANDTTCAQYQQNFLSTECPM